MGLLLYNGPYPRLSLYRCRGMGVKSDRVGQSFLSGCLF